MPSKIEARLTELGLALPPAPQPLNSYQHVVIVGELAFVAGQPPLIGSERPYTGRLGDGEGTLKKGQEATKLAALNVLAQLKVALGGDLDRVVRCVKLGVFDIAGRQVASLSDMDWEAGSHSLAWSGRMEGGALAPGGVYVIRMVARSSNGGEYRAQKTMIRIN